MMPKILSSKSLQLSKTTFSSLHNHVLSSYASLDGNSFYEDEWFRDAGGGGISCVIENGSVFEKAAVNFSYITGDDLPHSALKQRVSVKFDSFVATGVSVIAHPINPYVPTSHMNVRVFFLLEEGVVTAWWFGGGYDLTPYFVFEEDVYQWHYHAMLALGDYSGDRYTRYKSQCDKYFYLPHRQEARGVGGIFYDQVNDLSFDEGLSLSQKVLMTYVNSYTHIVRKRSDMTFCDVHRDFQHYRRTRYAEFNLLYDRGTQFGIQSGGRIESIFASMPPSLGWMYQKSGDIKLFEKQLLPYLQPRSWV